VTKTKTKIKTAYEKNTEHRTPMTNKLLEKKAKFHKHLRKIAV